MKARGGWIQGSSGICRLPVLPRDACPPASRQFGNCSLQVLSIRPHVWAGGSGSRQEFPPGISSEAPSAGSRVLPLPWSWEDGHPAPCWHAGPLRRAPPPQTCLCSGFSLTFSPSSAQWIYFYLHRLLLICPCYYPSLQLPLPLPSSLPLSQGCWRGQATFGGTRWGAGNQPVAIFCLSSPGDSLSLLREGRRHSLSSITPQILLEGCLLPQSPARPDGGGPRGPSVCSSSPWGWQEAMGESSLDG